MSITPFVGVRGKTRSPSSSKNRTVAVTAGSSTTSLGSFASRRVSSLGTRKLKVSVVTTLPKLSVSSAPQKLGPPTSPGYWIEAVPVSLTVCALPMLLPFSSTNCTVTSSVGKLESSTPTSIVTGPVEKSVPSAGVTLVTVGAGSSSVKVMSAYCVTAPNLSSAITYQPKAPFVVSVTCCVTVDAEVIVCVVPICVSSAAR